MLEWTGTMWRLGVGLSGGPPPGLCGVAILEVGSECTWPQEGLQRQAERSTEREDPDQNKAAEAARSLT